MEITDRCVATVQYELRTDDGTLVHSSRTSEPLVYIHGSGKLMPGLEKALLGKRVGDKFKALVAPAEAYGPRHERLVQVVPLSAFEGVETVRPGAKFLTDTAEGSLLATVIRVEGERVTVDGNHQLAGKTLHFDLEVTEVRDATLDEIVKGDVTLG